MIRLDEQRRVRRARLRLALFQFFFGAFALSWIIWGYAALLSQVSHGPLIDPLIVAGGFGPTVTAVFLIRRNSKQAWDDFRQRAFHGWRMTAKTWVAIAAVGLGPMLLCKLISEGRSQTVAVGLSGLAGIVVGALLRGFAEELGWRGFATDRMQNRWSTITSSVMLGIIWAFWHAPLFYVEGWAHHDAGSTFAGLFLLWIVAQSVIITAAYNATERSILVAVLVHASANLGMVLFAPTQGQFAFAVAIWVAIAVVVAARVRVTADDSAHQVLKLPPLKKAG